MTYKSNNIINGPASGRLEFYTSVKKNGTGELAYSNSFGRDEGKQTISCSVVKADPSTADMKQYSVQSLGGFKKLLDQHGGSFTVSWGKYFPDVIFRFEGKLK